MIEKLDNSIQLIVLGICLCIALYRAFSSDKQEWALLGMFYGATFAGNLYWILYLVFFGNTPYFSFIPDLSWSAGFLFLALLLLRVRDGRQYWKNSNLLWLVPAFTAGACIFFMQRGDFFANFFYALFMTSILWQSVNSLLFLRKHREERSGKKIVYISSLLFAAVEYSLWFSSFFYTGSAVLEPYYVFDFLLSVCYLLFIPALEKGVSR